MGTAVLQKNSEQLKQEPSIILKYMGEDDQFILVTGQNGASLRVPKNRNVKKPLVDRSSKMLTLVFRLLALAFLGLAPAGLGTLVFAPLAALLALVIWVIHPLTHADTLRVIIIWGLAAGLLIIAIPLSRLFLARFS